MHHGRLTMSSAPAPIAFAHCSKSFLTASAAQSLIPSMTGIVYGFAPNVTGRVVTGIRRRSA